MRVGVSSALAASFAVLCGSVDAAHRLNGWFPCGFSTSSNPTPNIFECGEVEVPLCHEGVCDSDRTISVFVKRLLANATDPTKIVGPPKSLWMLAGGPGGSSNGLESSMEEIHRLLNYTVNLYTMDHRGTGRSFFLQCDAAQAFASGSPSGIELSNEELPNCLRDILFQIDNHTAAFSVTSAAKDMAFLVQELHGGDEEVYVYGASYGTYLAERIMHLAPSKVKGYILDGVMAEDNPSFTTRNSDNVVPTKWLAELCRESDVCGRMFEEGDDDIYAAWQAMYKDLDELKPGENACADEFRDAQTTELSRSVKIRLADYSIWLSQRVLLPGMLELIHRCRDSNDLLAIQTVLKGGGAKPTTAMPQPERANAWGAPALEPLDVVADYSLILMYLLKASELWTFPSPSWSGEDKIFRDAVFPHYMGGDFTLHCLYRGNLSDPACGAIEADSNLRQIELVPFTYETDEFYRKFATIPDHASVLVINGKLDFQTMSDNGVRQYENMEGGNGKMMVEMDNGGHCVGISQTTVKDTTRCGVRIIASFVEQSGRVLDVDTSCMKELPAISLFTAEMIVENYVVLPASKHGEPTE